MAKQPAMPHLIARKQALANPVFASFIKHWQSRADPRLDPYMKEPGEYYDPKLDVTRFFTQEECDSKFQKELQEFELISDTIEEIPLVKHGELIYNHSTKDIKLYPQDMGNVLRELSALFDAPLILIPAIMPGLKEAGILLQHTCMTPNLFRSLPNGSHTRTRQSINSCGNICAILILTVLKS